MVAILDSIQPLRGPPFKVCHDIALSVRLQHCKTALASSMLIQCIGTIHDATTVPDPAAESSRPEMQSATGQGNEALSSASNQKSSILGIPSRISSKEPSSGSATAPATTAIDPPSHRRGSKGSFLTRSRNGSKSSRRSARAVRDLEAKESVPPIPQSDGARSEKKQRSGFLAFLNCCGGSSEANDTEGSSLPSKKTAIVQTSQQRIPKPTEKPASDAADGEPEKQDVLDEKTGVSRDTESSTAIGEKATGNSLRPQMTRDDGSREKVGPIAAGIGAGTVVAGAASIPFLQGQAGDTSSGESAQPAPADLTTKDQAANPEVQVQAPTPVDPVHQTDNEEWTQSKPEQGTDVDMPDAAPEAPATIPEPVDEPAQPAEQGIQPLPLPPAPPLSQRQAEVQRDAPSVPEGGSEKQTWLLPPVQQHLKGRKCLVLDLDETLVHSSFKILNQADFTIPVEIEGQYHNVYVIKRPGVDAFMKRVGELYEVVVFTASVSKYGDPLLDQLDIHHVVHHRLFRESCYNHQGNYVKVCTSVTFFNITNVSGQDLSQVGRDLKETIIIDNSPTSYIFHPQHAVPISSWFSDAHDNELLDLIPVLEDLAGSQVRDVSLVLDVAL